VAVAAIIAVTIVGTSFPASALLSQHRQLASATAQLIQVQRQNALLTEEEQQLKSTTEIRRLARQNYQLVLSGQTLYNVLPPPGQSAQATTGSTAFGDPGNQPLVPPAAAPGLMPISGQSLGTLAIGTTGPAPSASGGSSSGAPTSGGFWHRVSSTLEFWR
jgi:cell division protein FtsB